MKHVLVEAACGNLESVLAAYHGGADRIELCSALSVGGLTPSIGVALEARALVPVPLFVMIRPREGDFVYTEEEFQSMLHDIRVFRETGINGFVTGVLTEDFRVDEDRCRRLVDQARPVPVTFHRAFDRVREPLAALQVVLRCGFSRILTSGQAASAWEGREMIGTLVRLANKRISIMAGAGVTPAHVRELVSSTGVGEVHLSGKRPRHRTRSMEHDQAQNAMLEEAPDAVTDAEVIRAVKEALDR